MARGVGGVFLQQVAEAFDDEIDLRVDGLDPRAELGRYESPRSVLEKKVREHQERATFLTFVRDHVDPQELFRLDTTDLRMTEILSDKPW